MATFSLSLLLKSFLHQFPEHHPFDEDFDKVKFVDSFKKFVVNSLKEEDIVNDTGVIEFVQEIHELYQQLSGAIVKTLLATGLSGDDLVKKILVISNIEALTIAQMIEESNESREFNIPAYFTEQGNPLLKNVYGGEVHAQSATDNNIDTCNILFRIVATMNLPKMSKSWTSEPDELNILLRYIMLYANLSHIITEAFDYFFYEFGELERSLERLTFKHIPDSYYLRRRVGKERFNSHIIEAFVSRPDGKVAESKISRPSVHDSKLSFTLTGQRGANAAKMMAEALQISYYLHLTGHRFKALGGLDVNDLFRFITELQYLFQAIDGNDVLAKVSRSENAAFVPVSIGKKDLVAHLHKVTGIKEKIVTKLIGLLSSDISSEIDLWQTPMISIQNQYYFNIHAISIYNHAYVLQHMLKGQIEESFEYQAFRDYLTEFVLIQHQDIHRRLPKLKERTARPLPASLNESIIIELDTLIIIVEPCVIYYPLISSEYADAFEKIGASSDLLNKKATELRSYLGANETKELISIVAPNFPFFSGLVVNECFILDHFLLSNYFSSGEYVKGAAVTGNGVIARREISTHRYYSSEVEMSTNFRRFCVFPYPISQVMLQYEMKEHQIGFVGMSPAIFEDAAIRIPFTNILDSQVSEIEYCLRQLFYFEKALARREQEEAILTSKIEELLPVVINAVAFRNDDRYARLRVLDIFKNVGARGITYLIHSYMLALSRLRNKRFGKNKPFQHLEVDEVQARKSVEVILENSLQYQTEISLSSFKVQHSLSSREIINVLEYLLDLLSFIDQKKMSTEEFGQVYQLIILFAALSKEEPSYHRFRYAIFLNFIDALNFNFNYQQARNFAEEVLIYSFTVETVPLLGWMALSKCFLKQGSIFDAAFYGTLFLNCVDLIPESETDEELLTHGLFSAMLFFREYPFYAGIEQAIFDALKTLPLSEYDEQKITLSHYSSRLSKVDFDKINTLIDAIDVYLVKHLDAICRFGERAAVPWLSLLYNFIRLEEEGIINEDLSKIQLSINRLEAAISGNTLRDIKVRFFPIPDITKELFIEALMKIFNSVDFDNAAHELGNLDLLTKQVLKFALPKRSWGEVLLSGLVLNDQSLTFPVKQEYVERVPFSMPDNSEMVARINDYQKYICDNLRLTKGQLVVWVFDLDNKIYVVTINDQREIVASRISAWSVKSLKEWLRNNISMSFDDRHMSYFINEQERDYNNLASELSNFSLSLPAETTEVIYISSIELSTFPHNLIQISNPLWSQTSHLHGNYNFEVRRSSGCDFWSLYLPITNGVSLEWLLQQNQASSVLQEKTMQCWIPTDDDDYALMIGYKKLEPVLQDKYNCLIETTLLPEQPLNSSINIFMAHGGKGFDGFKTIYTRNEDGHAFIRQTGINRIFGRGSIAIVFVCHSAFLTPEAFSQRLVSFAHELLSIGYRAVIAPAWALNPIITPVWLEEFLDRFHEGYTISGAVFKANLTTAQTGYDEHHGFYAPSGWAAMHLYGNPHLQFAPDSF